MLARMIELLRGAAKEGKVVAVRGKYEAFGVEIVEDRWPGKGRSGESSLRLKLPPRVLRNANGI